MADSSQQVTFLANGRNPIFDILTYTDLYVWRDPGQFKLSNYV
jgi:hypothetical protein